jgi:ketosteroid isomerase-like protein
MSQQNIELVRSIYASLTRGGDDLLELAGPGVVVDFSRRLVDPFVLTLDEEAIEAFQRDALEAWEEPPTWEPQELLDADDKVVAFIRTRARGKTSGVEVDAHVANVWTFRDGEPVEVKYFGDDREAALAAAGLSE